MLPDINTEFALLHKADGSCHYTQGKTSVLVGIFGPIEAKGRFEKQDKASVQVHFQPRAENASPAHREIESIIRQTFESVIMLTLFPRTQITITVQEMNDDGCLLSACINGACLALVDAGIPMKSMVVSLSAAFTNTSELLLCCNKEEEERSKALFSFTFDKSLDGLVTSVTQGSFSPDDFWNVNDAIKKHCQTMLEVFRKKVEERG